MTKEELRQWIIEFAKAPAYAEVIEAIDSRINDTIRQAIASHEAGKWHYYPEQPREGEWILVERLNVQKIPYYSIECYFLNGKFIRWCELPKSYQEGGEG